MMGTIFNDQTQLLAYPNYIDIFGRSLEAVRDAYLALESEVTKIWLKINKQKTKYMLRLEFWLLATGILKSSTNLCTWELL
jgi:hypothetical protein